MTPSDRAIRRVKDEMRRLGLSQRDLAKRLNCSQGRIAKMINGRQKLLVDDLALLAESVGMTISELIRNPVNEFFAEMSPLELEILLAFRKRSQEHRWALMWLVGVVPPPFKQEPPLPSKPKVGRPLNSSRRGE